MAMAMANITIKGQTSRSWRHLKTGAVHGFVVVQVTSIIVYLGSRCQRAAISPRANPIPKIPTIMQAQ